MKALAVLILWVVAQNCLAGDAYRMYLLSRSQQLYKHPKVCATNLPSARFIPAYQIPEGSVFCRMEDKLTRLTGIWFKVGLK